MVTLEQIRDHPEHIPIAWSHGMGVDSAAVACLLVEWGVKVELTLMADTGGEHPETYEYIEVMNGFLREHGLPEVTVVRRDRYKHDSLEAASLYYDTLPSLAFGFRACSMAWKVNPLDKYCEGWSPAVDCWGRGDRVIRIIGFDYGDRDSERFAHVANRDDPKWSFWCPLREARLDRKACISVIKNAGLPVPRKSCCFFCPAMKKPEVTQLWREHPELAERAVQIELNAVQGKHGLGSTRGLGRSFSWIEHLSSISPRFSNAHEAEQQVMASHKGRRYHFDRKANRLVEVQWGDQRSPR